MISQAICIFQPVLFLLKRYGLKEGTTVVFQEDRGRLVVEPGNHAASMHCKEALLAFRSKRIWLRKDKRSRNERIDGERIRSGCKRGASLLRR